MTNENAFEHIHLGPLEPLLEDPRVLEILVNGTDSVWVDRGGNLQKTDVRFETEAQVVNVINVIVNAMGQQIDERHPIVDVRLPDNTRVNAVVRPVARTGPTLTIRKTVKDDLTVAELLEREALSEQMVDFLRASIRGLQTIAVTGGVGSGKTTVINALSEFFFPGERVITVEPMPELALRHDHIVSLELPLGDRDGRADLTMSDLIVNATKMRPERLITGEIRGPEAWDMLEAIAIGHDGSMFNLHANNVADALDRLEIMCTVGSGLPLMQIRARIVQALHIITSQRRFPDGRRRITAITEVVGLRNGIIESQDIFRWDAENGFHATGYRPTFADALELPDGFFA